MLSPESFKIAILGGGPAGLTLAALLNNSPHAYNFTIFELRGKPDPANVNIPSGSLDLQNDFGLAAVKDCGLHERFLEIESGCTEQTKILDRNGHVLMDREGEGRPEISRNALTHLLLSGVPEERIRWNTKVLKVSPATENEKGLVEFSEGDSTRSEEFDLIVGADGAWSRARASIPGAARPVHSGTISVTLDLPPLKEAHPDLHALLSGGTFVACGDAKCILTQRSLHDSARLYLFLHDKCLAEVREQLKSSTHNEQLQGPDPIFNKQLLSYLPNNHKDLKELLLTHDDFFATWPEDVKKLITVACDAQHADSEVDAGPLNMLPLNPFPHPHTKGMTLIGDAAHLMTPFAGKGVNTAMADASYLAKHLDTFFSSSISKDIFGAYLDEAITSFELESHAKGKDAMMLTWLSLVLTYEEGSPVRLIKVMSGKH